MRSSAEQGRSQIKAWSQAGPKAKLRGDLSTANSGLLFTGSISAFIADSLELVGSEWSLKVLLAGATIESAPSERGLSVAIKLASGETLKLTPL